MAGGCEWVGKDWIDVTQDRDRWRVDVNAVMNLPVFIKFC